MALSRFQVSSSSALPPISRFTLHGSDWAYPASTPKVLITINISRALIGYRVISRPIQGEVNNLGGAPLNRNAFHHAGLELPFEDEQFDIAWTEHVQMNIEDKNTFYSEIARVLKPGGRFVFHDVFRGIGDSPLYPLPWAEHESFSFLATEEDARAILDHVGLTIDQWDVKIQESLEFFKMVIAKIEADGPPPLGIHLLMGDNAKDKLQNNVRNLSENRLSVAMGMAHKK